MANNNRNQHDANDQNELPEESEVEITNLDGAENLPRLFNEPLFISRRYRGSITITTVLLSVAALLLILFTIFPIGALIKQAIPQPQQSSVRLEVEASPAWGRLIVDDSGPFFVQRQGQIAVVVSRGRHTLKWLAEPFQTQQCVMSVPVGSGVDSCTHPQFLAGSSDDLRLHMLFSENLSMLPADKREALTQAAQAALDQQQSTTMMKIGEPYTLASEENKRDRTTCNVTTRLALCFAKAHQPLQATLKMQLSLATSTGDCALGLCQKDGANCHQFCNMRDSLQEALNPTGISTMTTPNQWNPFVLVHLYWQFRTAAGQAIDRPQPDTFILGMQNDYLARLNIQWSGQKWQVTALPLGAYFGADAPICEAAVRDVYDLLFPVNQIVPGLHFIPELNPAEGCLIRIDTAALPTTVSHMPSGPAYLFQRFGVLVAANVSAHQLWPDLPVGDEHVQKLVSQWPGSNDSLQ